MVLNVLKKTRPETPSPDDWRWQSRNAATDLAGLEARLTLTDAERAGVDHALATGFAMAITPYYLGLCDPIDPQCPIRLQCVPTEREAHQVTGDLVDPLGEEANEVAPHLICRYPDRALLVASDRCAVYCRHCTRSRLVGQGGGARSLSRLAQAFTWLEEHPEVRDVIVSGGDPLIMSDARIGELLSRLASISSIEYVRVATRAPVTLPQRVTPKLCRILRESHPSVWVMTHFNHPKEVTPEAALACARLADHGLPVMNQTVLLRGVNDDIDTLSQLFRMLVRNRVRPYYLLQCDPVIGTSHLRTPLQTGLDLMEGLQGNLSGIALPKLIVDTPGGRGKVPIGPATIVASEHGVTTLRTFRGELVDYIDPPAPVEAPTGPGELRRP